MIVNKLAPWKKDYRCYDDCKMSGCPGHKATFTYYSATGGFNLDFGDGVDITIDTTQMELIKEYIDALTK